MASIDERGNQILQDVWSQVMRAHHEIELEEIEADPKKHKLTKIMGPKGSSYRYYSAGKDGRGWEVRFCYSCWRNAAGYFLGWREVIPPKGSTANHAGKRDKWIARKVRKRAAKLAKRRADAFKEKRESAQ